MWSVYRYRTATEQLLDGLQELERRLEQHHSQALSAQDMRWAQIEQRIAAGIEVIQHKLRAIDQCTVARHPLQSDEDVPLCLQEPLSPKTMKGYKRLDEYWKPIAKSAGNDC